MNILGKSNYPFFLFCKSYKGDLLRVKDLCASIQKHNEEEIPFYISVPQQDRQLFKLNVGVIYPNIIWLSDEDIVASNPKARLEDYRSWDGRLSQQVIKSEVWRLFVSNQIPTCQYLCIDSESIFLRNFGYKDFYASDGYPYTIMHDHRDLLELASKKGFDKVIKNFEAECEMMKSIFSRIGKNYHFGPTPVIWDSRVWQDLDQKYFKKNHKTIWDVIKDYPSELNWYGEALMQFNSINVHPIPPLFRVYHYHWQYALARKSGENSTVIAKSYLGVLKQSNWNFELDFGDQSKRKSIASKALRKVKRLFDYIGL
jgi:hypothetical protein